jgi:hypothetical protein
VTRRLTIKVENKHCALVNGYGSRDMLTELLGKPPLWSTISRSWVTTERTAKDLVAVAERRGFDILVTGPTSDDLVDPRPDDLVDPGRGLW